MFKVVFGGFSWVFDPSFSPIKPKWGPNCADDAGVRAHARTRTGASSAQLATHFGPFSVQKEYDLPNLKDIPGSQNIFFCTLLPIRSISKTAVGSAFTRWLGGPGGRGERPGRHLPPGPEYRARSRVPAKLICQNGLTETVVQVPVASAYQRFHVSFSGGQHAATFRTQFLPTVSEGIVPKE